MFLLNISIPFFNYLELYEIPAGNRLALTNSINVPISKFALNEAYWAITFTLLGSSIGWLITYKFNKANIFYQTSINTKNSNKKKYSKYLFYLIWIISVLYSMLILKNSLTFGYVNAIHLNKGLNDFTRLSQKINKKEFIVFFAALMVPAIIKAVAGQRGDLMISAIMFLILYSHYFKPPTKTFITLISTSFFAIIVFLELARFSRSLRFGADFIFETLLPNFLGWVLMYGGSLSVVAYTIELKDEFFNNVPFLFGYIVAIFSTTENYSFQGVLDKSYLAQHLTYLLRPDKLYGGSTLGTSIVAEFYELSHGNPAVIFILAAVLLMLANVAIRRIGDGWVTTYIAFIYLQEFVMSPRGSVMKMFNKNLVIAGLLFLIIIGIFLLLRRKKTKGSNE